MEMCISNIYKVSVCDYAKRHYMEAFEKKYWAAWEKTFKIIENMLRRIDELLKTSKATKIHICKKWYIAKCEFKIAWSNESAKTSWNRIIIYVDTDILEVKILLIYTKTDIKGNNETAWREKEIKNNFKEIYLLFENQQ